MDLISIIVPVYNSEKYLKKCIDSIICQTYKNLQIIIVNDGSTDNSSKIISKYNDKRIEIIDKENGGLSDARNYGMKFAKGKYITFIDSDDIVSINMIEIMYHDIINNKAEIAECQYFRFFYENELIETTNKNKKEIVLSCKQECMEILNARKKSMVCGRLFLTSLWDEIEFPKGKYFEDQFTFYKILLKTNKIVEEKTPLYYYRRNPQSIVSVMNKKKAEDFITATDEMTENIINRYPEYNDDSANIKVINRLICIVSINNAEYKKNKEYLKKVNNYINENGLKVAKNKKISNVKRIKIRIYIFNNNIGKFIIIIEQKMKLTIQLLKNIIKRIKYGEKK